MLVESAHQTFDAYCPEILPCSLSLSLSLLVPAIQGHRQPQHSGCQQAGHPTPTPMLPHAALIHPGMRPVNLLVASGGIVASLGTMAMASHPYSRAETCLRKLQQTSASSRACSLQRGQRRCRHEAVTTSTLMVGSRTVLWQCHSSSTRPTRSSPRCVLTSGCSRCNPLHDGPATSVRTSLTATRASIPTRHLLSPQTDC